MNVNEQLIFDKQKYVKESTSTFFNRFKAAYTHFLNEYIPLHSLLYGLIPAFILGIICESSDVHISIKFFLGFLIFVFMFIYSAAFFNALLSLKYLSRKRTTKICEKNFNHMTISEDLFIAFIEEFDEKEIKNYFNEEIDKKRTTNSDIKRYISSKNQMKIVTEEELKSFVDKYTSYEVERMRREKPHHFITRSDLEVMKYNSKKYVFNNPMYNVLSHL